MLQLRSSAQGTLVLYDLQTGNERGRFDLRDRVGELQNSPMLGEPHQIINNGTADLVLYVVADNPIGESCDYPDSNKWSVPMPEHRLLRSQSLDYYDGEE